MRTFAEIGRSIDNIRSRIAQPAKIHPETSPVDPTEKDYQFWPRKLKDQWRNNKTIANNRVAYVNAALHQTQLSPDETATVAAYARRDLTLEDIPKSLPPDSSKRAIYSAQVKGRTRELVTHYTAQDVPGDLLKKYLEAAEAIAKVIGELYAQTPQPAEFEIRT